MLFGSKKKPKKTKKELQLEKNKRNLMLMQLSAMSRGEHDEGLGAPEYVKPKEKPKRAEGDQTDKPWSAKVQEVKNRNDSSRRAALDRFNRMAGTSEAGGRGR